MIVRMKKMTLIVSNRIKEDFLAELRKVGVVHIKHVLEPSSQDIGDVEEKIELLGRASALADNIKSAKERQTAKMTEEEAVEEAKELVAKEKQKDALAKHIQDVLARLEWFRPWGRFDPRDLEALKKEGVYVRLYRLRKNEFRKAKSEYQDRICIIDKEKDIIYAAFFSYKTDEKLAFDETAPPDKGPDALNKELDDLKRRTEEIEHFLSKAASFKEPLKKHAEQLRYKLRFLKVKSGMKDEGTFSYLEGFCPREDTEKAVSLAGRRGAGYIIEDPGDPDETPTLIRNPRWLSIIEPVFKFMNTLPGYGEHDVSFPFLLFFSLFFAMLIGDAGYGILFIAITYFMRRKMKNAPPAPFLLMYLLSVATIIWGAITGTWFGFEQIARMPFANALIISGINSFVSENQNFMIYLCFLIGAVHLSAAHLMRGLRVLNSVAALAQLGWILILWGLFFTAGMLVLGHPFPPFAGYLFVAGAPLIILFSDPQRNIARGIVAAATDLPLKIISSFADIVSYLRLFAVGYATVIVASSFNDIALSSGFGNIAKGLATALILFFGHALNILLGLMSVIVHGIRLNMLEFSGHLEMQWSGKEYSPFREDRYD